MAGTMRLFVLAALALTVSGCATSSPPILMGDHHYPPLPPNAPVQVFMKASDIHQSFEVPPCACFFAVVALFYGYQRHNGAV